MKEKTEPVQNDTIRKKIESEQFKLAVASVLPMHVTPARFVRISIAALTRVPKLAECDPNTVLQCLMQLSQFGLEPDGRNAHLIPFWNSRRSVMECQLIVDYKGLVDLAMRSGKVAFVHADKVCEKDVFEWDKGQVVKHEINFKEDRGKPYAYYAIARMKDGTEQAEAMTLADVTVIRQRSRAANAGPWVTDFDEMAKKTVFRRLSKWLQLSPEYREALDVDTDALEELRFDNALQIKRAKVPKLNDKDLGGVTREGHGRVEDSTLPASRVDTTTPTRNNVSAGGDNQMPETDTQEPEQIQSPAPSPAAPASEKKTKLQRKKKAESPSEIPPNQAAMLARLNTLNKTPEDLMRVLKENEWIDADATWPIEEIQLSYFLESENWLVVAGELQALPK